MIFSAWLTIVAICLLGAMSPGPSLAIILQQTLQGGRSNGCIAALAHGFGIGLYAMVCISGLAFVITANQQFFVGLQIIGAAYLIWLGVKGLLAKPATAVQTKTGSSAGAARDGFLVVFLNPKIAVFFIALFSQIIGPETSWAAKCLYALTAGVIDAVWYLLVAWLFSTPRWLARLQQNAVWFERLFGAILMGLAIRLIWPLLSGL